MEKPSKMRGRWDTMAGGVQSGLGRVLRNEEMVDN
jgi:hypothetical protein